MKKLKLGVIGCGGFSHYHLDGWKKIKEVELVAICGHRNVERLKSVADKYNIKKRYFDYSEMFKKEDLDFIDIVSPSSSHKNIIANASENGLKHILCEKPLAENMDDAVEIVNICESNNIKLTVFQNFRWYPWYLKIKELIGEKKIKEVFYASIVHRSSLLNHFDLYNQMSLLKKINHFTLGIDKLVVLELALHFFDILRFLFGEPKSIYCKARNIIKDSRGENVSISLIEFESLDALVEVSWCSIGDDIGQRVLIEGTNGSILLDDEGDNAKLKYYMQENTGIKKRPGFNHPATKPVLMDIDSKDYFYKGIYNLEKKFVESILNGTTLSPSGRDNLKTLAMVFGAYESIESGKVVKLVNGNSYNFKIID